MPKVTLRGHIVVPTQALEAVSRELANHIELTRKELGCLIFEVNQDSENPIIFHVYEEFIDRTSFEAHQRRVQCSTWGQVAKNVERNYEITESGSCV